MEIGFAVASRSGWKVLKGVWVFVWLVGWFSGHQSGPQTIMFGMHSFKKHKCQFPDQSALFPMASLKNQKFCLLLLSLICPTNFTEHLQCPKPALTAVNAHIKETQILPLVLQPLPHFKSYR